jgi:hypothetical protein
MDPLNGALGVARSLATPRMLGRETVDRVGQLARQHRGVHFIELPHAVGAARGDERRSAAAPAFGRRPISRAIASPRWPVPGAVDVVVVEQGERAPARRQKGVLHARRLAVEQGLRTLQPSVGDGHLTLERDGVPREPHGDTGRGHGVLALPVQAVGPLARFEHEVGLVDQGQQSRQLAQVELAVGVGECQ